MLSPYAEDAPEKSQQQLGIAIFIASKEGAVMVIELSSMVAVLLVELPRRE